jgi:hypothetical protein
MYTTCIYCHKPLGSNECIESFPVGRRLAFDASKGRLWVVCRACERWNLSPLDSRWEAIEECEREFSVTRKRVSTDNIGLARLTEGLELVRIGAPQRPEFAAWRYGDQFGRRRRRAYLLAGGVAVGVGAVVAGAAAAGVSVTMFGGMWGNIPNLINSMRRVRLRGDDGRTLTVRGTEFQKARLLGVAGAPILTVKVKGRIEEFRGAEALRHAGRLLPAINVSGASKETTTSAVQLLEIGRGAESYVDHYLGVGPGVDRRGRPRAIATLPAPTRLALEMALHEEAERRAIEGELGLLEAAWQEAEVIAAISDSLFVPSEVERQLEALKRSVGAGGSPPSATSPESPGRFEP